MSRFRVSEGPIALHPDTVDLVIKASCALHNWLRTMCITVSLPPGAVDTEDYNTKSVFPGYWKSSRHVKECRM
jgi:hypothetical protein